MFGCNFDGRTIVLEVFLQRLPGRLFEPRSGKFDCASQKLATVIAIPIVACRFGDVGKLGITRVDGRDFFFGDIVREAC